MPQSLSRVIVHVIFSTKNRARFIDERIEGELFAYLGGMLKARECPPIAIGGADDHVHILCLLSRTKSISAIVQEVKQASSKWIKNKGALYHDFAWQSGYGAFSLSPSHLDAAVRYLAGQRMHHRKATFQEEYLAFLARHGVTYDERHLWD